MAKRIRVYRLKEASVIARDSEVWIGIDEHAKSMHVTVVDAKEVLHRGSYPAGRAHVEGLIARLPGCTITAAYEAGPTGYRLVRWLREAGCKAFMTPPSLRPVAANKRVKTDRRDSLEVAEALRAGMLKEVRNLTDEEYAHRELVRTREQIVGHRADIQRQIKSKLLYHRIELPAGMRTNWSNAFLAWLEEPSTGHVQLDCSLKALATVWHALTTQIAELTCQIRNLAKTEKYAKRVELLRSVRGVGVLTAMIVLTELQDFERFGSNKELASFLGLVPGEHSSGDTTRKGRITHAGNRRVRTALVEVSWFALKKEPELKRFFDRVCAGKQERRKKAIVAVARKLSGRIRAMMLNEETYRYPAASNEAGQEDAA